MKELRYRDPMRGAVRQIVLDAVCPDPRAAEKHRKDYVDTFETDSKTRVLAAFRDGEVVGGVLRWREFSTHRPIDKLVHVRFL